MQGQPSVSRSFFDGVDAIGVEDQMAVDGRHCRVGRLIRPNGIGRTLATERNTEISAVAFIRTVRGVLRPLKEGHIDVLARDIENRRIARFLQGQRIPRVGDDATRNHNYDPIAVALDRDRMIGAGSLDVLRLR
jgi:hypothetical protein